MRSPCEAEDQSPLRSRGPSGFITRTPGVPTNRCAAAASTTARPRRGTLRSSPTAVIHATFTPPGSAVPPGAWTTGKRESDRDAGLCLEPLEPVGVPFFNFRLPLAGVGRSGLGPITRAREDVG